MTRNLLAVAALVAALPGWAHASDLSSHVMAMCPMSVTGTAVVASDAVNGEALTFTTGGEVAELRTRVQAMAKIHNEHHADAGARPGMVSGGMRGSGNAMNGASMPPSWATVTDVERGAIIVFVPNAAGDLEAVQAAIRASAERMQKNGCEMMGQTRR
jgi:hypothetical protein